MTSTAHKTEAELKEHYQDEGEVLQRKAAQLAGWIRASKHFVAFTGAGVSTSTGIPDFRGPQGVWTLRDQGKRRTAPTTSTTKAVPSPCHMALVALERAGLLKYVVSQNVDGLHRRSGLPADKLAEVHGNTYLEICRKCGMRYMRDYKVRRHSNHVHDHETDRRCDNPKCNGPLDDSIVNFGENLPESELHSGFKHCRQSDVCLVLGSSLRVTPAADMPAEAAEGGSKLVIVNLQTTPLDGASSMRIFARCDVFIQSLMRLLNIPVPEFLLQRRLKLLVTPTGLPAAKCEVAARGVDEGGRPFSFLRHVKVVTPSCTLAERLRGTGAHGRKLPEVLESFKEREPLKFSVRTVDWTHWLEARSDDRALLSADVTLGFFGHYGEPKIVLPLHMELRGKDSVQIELVMVYNPRDGSWAVSSAGADEDDVSIVGPDGGVEALSTALGSLLSPE